MIRSLRILNYALIEDIYIEWNKGLNIITGETGSGKSILLGALGLVMGDRADVSVLTQPGKKCIVEAALFCESSRYTDFFLTHELDFDENTIIRREISPLGKSRAFINDTPVSLQTLKSLTLLCFDLHAQQDTTFIHDSDFQLQVIDVLSGSHTELIQYKTKFESFRQHSNKLQALQNQLEFAEKEKDYIAYLLAEFRDISLKPGEKETLELSHKKAEHARQLTEWFRGAHEVLSGSALDILHTIKQQLLQASKISNQYSALFERVNSMWIEMKDLASEFENQADEIQSEPEALSSIEARLQLIYKLEHKHKVNGDEKLIELQNQLENQLSGWDDLRVQVSKAEKLYIEAEKQMLEAAQQLSDKRITGFDQVLVSISQFLPEAGMPNAVIKIKYEKMSPGLMGQDNIHFLISSNKGSEFTTLSKTASGGELSRLMLCVKLAVAGKVKLPVLIFDEIDTGISGEIALKVGKLMQQLSRFHQLIVVTHLPQIAGQGDLHIKIYKTESEDRTFIKSMELCGDDRINELAEMMGGHEFSAATRKAAKELIDKLSLSKIK